MCEHISMTIPVYTNLQFHLMMNPHYLRNQDQLQHYLQAKMVSHDSQCACSYFVPWVQIPLTMVELGNCSCLVMDQPILLIIYQEDCYIYLICVLNHTVILSIHHIYTVIIHTTIYTTSTPYSHLYVRKSILAHLLAKTSFNPHIHGLRL